MKFEDVRRDAQDLAELIAERTGRSLVAAVTVPEPEEPPGELHFVRLVSWGYVLLNEAGSTVFKELARLLKSTRPELSKTYQDGKRDIEALRTSLAHNLADGSSANERTKRVAEAWMLQNGGPDQWPSYCTALLQTLRVMLTALRQGFLQLCDKTDGAQTGLEQLLAAVDKNWPPHLFDDLVAEIAHEIGLPPLDTVAFRKPRQEQWANLASLFSTHADGTIAMRRVIRAELQRVFGPVSVHSG
ncbi:hypothetical protein LA66_00440 [Aureimonas altamirensis]|uniref:Uncharacterized protein n=1 Tax=Aureimonas altamirensis TaxID=370622 RepID=A0A0B1Q477_9HYPH|nr:hypothetical protein [Aureimonas altamirensis]KHJ55194.1 hypothetical protein LA66_00440 [Aureimonas altamirensis]